jgi:hypothetical protein
VLANQLNAAMSLMLLLLLLLIVSLARAADLQLIYVLCKGDNCTVFSLFVLFSRYE